MKQFGCTVARLLLALCLLAQVLPVMAEETIYTEVYQEDFAEKPAAYTDAVTDDSHYAKWDDGKIAVYNADGTGAQRGTLTLPQAYTQEGLRIALSYTEGENHFRMKLFFLDSAGAEVKQIYMQRRTEGLVLLDSTSSVLDASLKKGAVGDRMRLEVEFHFETQSIRVRNAVLSGDAWDWSGWTGDIAMGAGRNVASLRFSNEYAKCNLTIDDLCVSVPEGGSEPPEEEPELPFDEEEAGYERAYTERFDEKPAAYTDAVTDDSHYAKWDDGKIAVYNADGTGAQRGTLALPQAYTQEGLRIALSYVEGENHARMKLFFLDSAGAEVKQIYMQRRTEGLVLLDSTSSVLDASLKKGAVGDRMRLEVEFHFETQSIRVRNAVLSGDAWDCSDWTGDIAMGAGRNVASLRFSNEYAKCNLTIDDLRVSVPEGGSEPPEEEPEPPSIEEEEPAFIRMFTETFDEKPETMTDVVQDETHYVKWEDGKIVAYNANATGAQRGVYTLGVPVTEGAKLGFTLCAGEGHSRMKLFYNNSASAQVHTNMVSLVSGKIHFRNNSYSLVHQQIPQVSPGELLRMEIIYYPSRGTVKYRGATAADGKWNWCDWSGEVAAEPSGAPVDKVIAALVFSNEYTQCNMTIDDVTVSLPKEKPVAQDVSITGYSSPAPRSGETLEGHYTFSDRYGDAESGTVCEWVLSDDAAFLSPEVLPANGTCTLTLDDSYLGRYIKLRVTPATQVQTGDPVESEIIGPVLAAGNRGIPPVVDQLAVAGSLFTGRAVTASYRYSDDDLDPEYGTQIVWAVGASPDGSFETVQTGEVFDGADNTAALTYVIADTDNGAYLRVSVTPKNQAEQGSTGETVTLTAGPVEMDPVQEDLDAINTGQADGARITGDLLLPVNGANGSQLVWESSNRAAIDTDGSVTRDTGDVSVTLTVTATLDGYSLTRTFHYTVAARTTTGGGGGGGGGTSSRRTNSNAQLSLPTELEQELSESQPQNAPVPEPFNDLDEAAWAKEYIVALAAQGMLSGDGDGRFTPNRAISREELVKLAVVAAAVYDETAAAAFTDVAPDAWYTTYIASAVQAGIVEGRGDGTFGVGEAVTRQDMAVIFCRAAGLQPLAEAAEPFTDDEEIAAYARGAVYALQKAGILNGRSDGSFGPLETATRAEAAKLVALLLDL